jgi:hypothetical protein
MLTEQDVQRLFEMLALKLNGNRSEAARRCGLTGKTTYDWEKAGYVKLRTKKKVLEACLEVDFLGTIEYLLSQSTERTIDVLRAILSTIYADAIEITSREEFVNLFDKFEKLKVKYRGLIKDQIEDEVSDMSRFLKEKALEFGMPIREISIEDLSTRQLLDAIQVVGRMYVENPLGAEKFLKEDLNLPTEAWKQILEIFKELSYVKGISIEAEKTIDQQLWPEIKSTEESILKSDKKLLAVT